jgi:hypothetical protein
MSRWTLTPKKSHCRKESGGRQIASRIDWITSSNPVNGELRFVSLQSGWKFAVYSQTCDKGGTMGDMICTLLFRLQSWA